MEEGGERQLDASTKFNRKTLIRIENEKHQIECMCVWVFRLIKKFRSYKM